MRAATVEGSPNTPLPMMEFTIRAIRLQRRMARTRSWRGAVAAGDSIARLYHKRAMLGQQPQWGRGASPTLGQPRAALSLSKGGCLHMVCAGRRVHRKSVTGL